MDDVLMSTYAAEIGALFRRAKAGGAEAVRGMLECGRLLVEQKRALGRGDWLPWLEANRKALGFGEDTAQRLMRAGKTASTRYLTDDEALALSREIWGNKPAREPVKLPPASKLPDGIYNLIYADPPWRYEFAESDSRKIENQYPTMPLEDIRALPVKWLAAEHCLLFMWSPSPKLAEALSVIAAWEFTYRTCAVWVKPQIGMGYYFRQQHELLLVATRGNPGTPAPADRPGSVLTRDRTRHSAKPVEYYDMIELMYPGAKRIELFCREPRDGWTSWGNEIVTVADE